MFWLRRTIQCTIILLSVLALPQRLCAQSAADNSLDSLQGYYRFLQSRTPEPDSVKLELASRISALMVRQQHPNTEDYINLMGSQARQLNKPIYLGKVDLLKSQHLLNSGSYQKAYRQAELAYERFSGLGLTDMAARALIRRGQASEYLGNTDEAHRSYFRALNLVEDYCQAPTESLCGIATCMANMFVGGIYWKRELPDKAREYVNNAKVVIEELYLLYPKNTEVIYEYATLLSNMASLSQNQDNPTSQINYYLQALTLFQKVGMLESEVITLFNIANTYFRAGNMEQARHYAQESLAAARQGTNPSLPLNSLNLIARINLEDNNPEEAVRILDQAQPVAEETNQYNVLSEILKLRARIDTLKGDFTAGYESLQRYYRFRDSLFNTDQLKIINTLEAQYAQEKQEKELALNEQRLAREESNRTLRASIILILALTILSGTLISYLINRNLIRQRELARQKERVAILESKQINADLEKKKLELDYKNKELATMATRLLDRNNFIDQLRAYLNSEVGGNPDMLHDLKKQLSYQEQATGDLEEFRVYVDEMNRDFFYNLSQRYPDLTENEKRLCAMLRLNLSVKDIATINSVSDNAVRTAKHRLRKKMNLNDQDDLKSYLEAL